jgi:hypothetical protein
MWGEEPKHRETEQHFDDSRFMKCPKCVELLCRREEVKYGSRTHH